MATLSRRAAEVRSGLRKCVCWSAHFVLEACVGRTFLSDALDLDSLLNESPQNVENKFYTKIKAARSARSFAPFRACARPTLTQGLRPGLHYFAAMRLSL